MNLDKLDAAIEWIEAHPEQHDQAYYNAEQDCGTTMCLAGVIAMQAGWEPAWNLGHQEALHVFGTRSVKRAGRVGFTSDVAAEILGANEDQRSALFLEAVDLAGIKWLRDEYAESAPSGEAGERSDKTTAVDLPEVTG